MLNGQHEIAIVGAGIGGLTLALALQKKGIPFIVYEQAPSFEALGYGIQLSPNAVRVLRALDVLNELAEMSHECHEFEIRCINNDSRLASWNQQSNVPYYQCRRADIHALLYAKINPDLVKFNHKLTASKQENDGVELTFADHCKVRVSALIAADGVNSSTRKEYFSTRPARHSGYSAYRAIIPYQKNFDSQQGKTVVWFGENQHIVLYPNGKKSVAENEYQQKQYHQWMNVVLIEKTNSIETEQWDIQVDKKIIIDKFSSNSALLSSVFNVLETSVYECFRWGVYYHAPLQQWHKHNIVLLGDAAHAMVPFMAQGAAMAIEDAYVLAELINRNNSSLAAVFAQYSQLRIERVTKVQKLSLANVDIFHAKGMMRFFRDTMSKTITKFNPSIFAKRTEWIYDYDVTKLKY